MEPKPEPDVVVQTFPVGPLQCNCSIVGDRRTGEAVIVDPGWDPDLILDRVRRLGMRIAGLVHTHAHIDHINGTLGVHRELAAPALLHADDLPLYRGIEEQAAILGLFGLPVDVGRDIHPPPDVERLLGDGDTVGRGHHEMEVLHTPGHTPGSISFLLRASGGSVVFAGDTLFSGGVGRTDLWGGDSRALRDSIRNRLYGLPPETVVVAGHGPSTTIDRERVGNPFVTA